MNGFSRKPIGLTPDVSSFIEGAEKRTEQPTPPVVPQELPWNAPGVREDLIKTFNIRLPEPYHLKLAYIAEHTPHSMHNFCMNVLKSAIDAEIEELTGKKAGG
ncbi:MAG: hypothetical protein GY934_05460 [Gammaproteobacteria bacterium]|nr:hypothetical protein [Gammaproteobacteria bacterium]